MAARVVIDGTGEKAVVEARTERRTKDEVRMLYYLLCCWWWADCVVCLLVYLLFESRWDDGGVR